jgi:hypothetical protein
LEEKSKGKATKRLKDEREKELDKKSESEV